MTTPIDYACFILPVVRTLLNIIKGGGCLSNNIHAIVILKKGGKSILSRSCESKSDILIDLEQNMEVVMDYQTKDILSKLDLSSRKLHYYPKAKEYLKTLVKAHKNKKMIIFSSDIELMNYIGIKKNNIHTFIPSAMLSNTITKDMDEKNKTEFDTSKMEVIMKANKTLTYDTFSDLQKELMKVFPELQLKA